MSFRVSNSFNLAETIEVTILVELFQRLKRIVVKHALNQPPIASCSTVSVVSLLIDIVNETEKVFGRCQRVCVHIVIGLQDYTGQLADGRMQRLQHAL